MLLDDFDKLGPALGAGTHLSTAQVNVPDVLRVFEPADHPTEGPVCLLGIHKCQGAQARVSAGESVTEKGDLAASHVAVDELQFYQVLRRAARQQRVQALDHLLAQAISPVDNRFKYFLML